MKFQNIDKISRADFEVFDKFFLQWIPTRKQIWLFGMGKYGKAMRNFLKDCGVPVAGFVVSALPNNRADRDDAVIDINDFKELYSSKIDSLGLVMGLSSQYYAEILPKLYFAYEDMYFFDEPYKDLILKHCGTREKMKISWALTDHCNLSCYSCQVAAPIARKKFYDLSRYKEELRKADELLGERLFYIGLTTAEPLLHPEFLDFVVYARRVSSNAKIHVITNGILLYKQDAVFWKTLSENSVRLTWTQYPIKYGGPPREIFEKAEKFGVLLSYAVDSNYTADKESWEMKVQTNGKKSHPWDYALCFMHNDCITMYNGKLYTCHRNIMWEHCDSKFGMQSHVCADDGLDIFRANAGEELLRFVSFRPKLCDYCRVRDFRCVGAWQASGRGKNEWIFDGTEATQEC